MTLFDKRITEALISLRGCAGWSATVFFQTPEDRFSHVKARMMSVMRRVPCVVSPVSSTIASKDIYLNS